MVFNFQRPNLPYEAQSLPNSNRYQLLTRSSNRPPTDIMLDTDFDYIIDGMRKLDLAIVSTGAGILPGADDPNNQLKVPVTDGANHIGWTQITDAYIAPNSITNLSIMPQTITANEIQNGTITATQLADGAVTTEELEDLSVTAGKIGLGAVTAGKIGLGAVTEDKIGVGAVTTDKIGPSSVTALKLASQSVGTTKLVALAVTAEKIGSNAVTTDKILNANVTTDKLAALAVTAEKIANNTITFTQISDTFTATKAQQQAGSSTSVYTSPGTQQYHPSAASAWVMFNGTTGVKISSYNVSSVFKQGTGSFLITFANAFASSSYACFGTAQFTNIRTVVVDDNFPRSTTQVRVNVYGSSTVLNDSAYVNVLFYGELA